MLHLFPTQFLRAEHESECAANDSAVCLAVCRSDTDGASKQYSERGLADCRTERDTDDGAPKQYSEHGYPDVSTLDLTASVSRDASYF